MDRSVNNKRITSSHLKLPAKIKVPEKDFDKFVVEFKKYQKLFRLEHFRVSFYFTNLEHEFAKIFVDANDFIAAVGFSSEIDQHDKSQYDIEKIAKHEAIHLLIGEYVALAEKRYCEREAMLKEEEKLVRTLELLL